MKFLLALAICAFMAAPAFAAFEGPGANAPADSAASGFKGPMSGAQAETVQKALTLPDKAPVTLTGNIVRQLAGSDDKYIFRDSTGEIQVDIDRKKLRGITVTPQNTVRISGKIDKDFNEPIEVDVKYVEIVK